MSGKIKSVTIKNFRGITAQQSMICNIREECESVLLIGDNGIGKSSFIDAIELATIGKIHNSSSKEIGGWIYSSVSRYGDSKAYIELELESGEKADDVIELDAENARALVKRQELIGFNKAPFILRRRDITDFWNLASVQRLSFFIPYSRDMIAIIPDEEKGTIEELEKKRLKLKEERRIIIKDICKFYNLDYDDMSKKNRNDFFTIIELLNHKISFKNLSTEHPMYDRLKNLNKTYEEVQICNRDINDIKRRVKQVSTSVNGKFSDLKEKMIRVSPLVTQDFKEISKTNNYISKIEINVAEKSDVSIEFVVILDNGKQLKPEVLFSEANRDLLALLIFFEFIYLQADYGQEKVVVMDDIFQSVDATIRFRLMQFLVEKFKDWQLILTTHDRLWKEQLTQLFRSHGKPLIQYEIKQWDFQNGPQLVGTINPYDEKVLYAIENGSVSDVCAAAGYLLEYMSNELSYILHISVQRKRGERYTIGDLWPGVFKAIKKSPAKIIFTNLNDLVFLRNVVGSHYNEWSLSLSRTEAVDFANAVLESYYRVYSKNNGKWITSVEEITGEIL